MTFNEINNQSNTSADIFGWTDSGVLFSQYENKKKAMYQAAHYEMVAGAMVVKKGHEINPDFKIGCMCSFVPFYPYSCDPDDIMTATECMHERFYFADVQIRGHYPAFAKKEWEREGTKPGDAAGYKRALNISDAVATTVYKQNGVKYEREVFASHPDNVIVMHLKSDTPNGIDISLDFTSPHPTAQQKGTDDRLILHGQAPGYVERRTFEQIEQWGDQYKHLNSTMRTANASSTNGCFTATRSAGKVCFSKPS